MNCNYPKGRPSIEIMGIRVDAVQIPDVIQHMEGWITKNIHHNYIVVANMDTAVTGKFNPEFKEAVNKSSLAIPDGFPLLLAGRLRGHTLKKRAYGPDLLLKFLEISEEKGYSHFFYGATEETLGKLIKNIKNKFPKIKIAGSYAPPFRPLTQEEDKVVVDLINKAAPSVLWVGIGCPKQELWMRNHREKLNIPVMLGVGAAFDFIAGTKPQAPRWISDNGFEWLFRLTTEPKRLWRRYLINYPLFVYYVLVELAFKSVKSLLNK